MEHNDLTIHIEARLKAFASPDRISEQIKTLLESNAEHYTVKLDTSKTIEKKPAEA